VLLIDQYGRNIEGRSHQANSDNKSSVKCSQRIQAQTPGYIPDVDLKTKEKAILTHKKKLKRKT